MVSEEGKPLVIVDQGGAFRGLRRTTEKGYRKSVENGAVWELDPETGRILPYREDLSLIRMTDAGGFYVCVLSFPDGISAAGAGTGDIGRSSAGAGGRTAAAPPDPAPGAGIHALDSASGDVWMVRDADAVFSRLIDVIEDRRRNRPAGSYTSYLFGQGEEKIRKKTGEEAVELILARDDAEIVCETADLLYHLLVLLSERGIGFERILGELERRAGS